MIAAAKQPAVGFDPVEHRGVVWQVVLRDFWSYVVNGAFERDELLAVGYVALVRASHGYDGSSAITSYVTTAARRAIQLHIRRNSGPISAPSTSLKRLDPTARERAVAAMVPAVPFSPKADERRSHYGNPYREAELRDEIAAMWRAIDELPERLWYVVQWRYKGETLDKIGCRLGVTRERARQLEAEAFRMIRRAMADDRN